MTCHTDTPDRISQILDRIEALKTRVDALARDIAEIKKRQEHQSMNLQRNWNPPLYGRE